MDFIEKLIEDFALLPGIGKKSAMRIALYLVQNRNISEVLLNDLDYTIKNIKICKYCNNLSTDDECNICKDNTRDKKVCVVETISDLYAIEETKDYKGYYFVLSKLINPSKGIFVEDLGLDKLKNLIINKNIEEVIFMLNYTPEAQITIDYIKEYLDGMNLRFSKISVGIPIGASIEFLDKTTLRLAFNERKEI